MLAAQVEALGRMSLVEKPIPVPGTDSLLIKVEGCAICGSDVRIFRKGDSRASYPIVIGHEIAGSQWSMGSLQTVAYKDGVFRGSSDPRRPNSGSIAPGRD